MNSGSSSNSQANPVSVPVDTKPVEEQKRKSHKWLLWVLVVLLVVLLVWALSSGKGLGVQCYKVTDLKQLCAGLTSAGVGASSTSSMGVTMPSPISP